MEGEDAVRQALGSYRPPWYVAALPFVFGVLLIAPFAISPSRSFHDFFAVLKFAFAIFLLLTPLIPSTVVRSNGVLLPIKFKWVAWRQVATVQEIDVPGSKESIRLRLDDGDIITLTGVPASRLPGIIRLAEAAQAT